MNKGALIRAILPLLCIDPPARAEGIAVPPRNDLYHGVYPGGESGILALSGSVTAWVMKSVLFGQIRESWRTWKVVAELMTREQLAEAQRLAREWRPEAAP